MAEVQQTPAKPDDAIEQTSQSDDVLDALRAIVNLELPFPEARRMVIREFEVRYVQRALMRSGGSISKAAAASGVGDRYFRMIRARNRPSAPTAPEDASLQASKPFEAKVHDDAPRR